MKPPSFAAKASPRKRLSRRLFHTYVSAMLLALYALSAAAAQMVWDAPAARIAEQIAALLGPGEVQFELTNRSSIPSSDLPVIRKAMDDALRSRGIHQGGAESANAIRLTLSENARERLWVAEITEGSEIRVVLVRLDGKAPAPAPAESGIVLQKKRLWSTTDTQPSGSASSAPVLSALELNDSLILLMPNQLAVLSKTASGWSKPRNLPITLNTDDRHGEAGRPLPRDPRGELVAAGQGTFAAYLPGVQCTGTLSSISQDAASEDLTCSASDDPWPLDPANSTGTKAFYNTARNYFTGIVVPGYGVDLPPFLSAAVLPQLSAAQNSAGPPALLVSSLSGGVKLVANGAARPVNGTRDWGSGLAIVRTACGSGAQILVSASGEATKDSLRAYELHGQEAVTVSPPLEIEGSVMSESVAQNFTGSLPSASVLIVVRSAQDDYEVDRVTPACL